jgi:hypothetical protein
VDITNALVLFPSYAPSEFVWDGQVQVSYANLASLTVDEGTGGDTDTISSTAAGVATTVDIPGGAVNVEGTIGPLVVNATGHAAITVGSRGAALGGVVGNIDSPVAIHGTNVPSSLTVDDSGNTNSVDLVTLTSTSLGAGTGDQFFPAGGSLTYSGVNAVTLDASNASSTDSQHAVHGDSITVIPQTRMLFTIVGNNPAVVPGDSLTVEGNVTLHPGTTAGSGYYTFTGSTTPIVEFTGIETLGSSGADAVVGGAADPGARPIVRIAGPEGVPTPSKFFDQIDAFVEGLVGVVPAATDDNQVPQSIALGFVVRPFGALKVTSDDSQMR